MKGSNGGLRGLPFARPYEYRAGLGAGERRRLEAERARLDREAAASAQAARQELRGGDSPAVAALRVMAADPGITVAELARRVGVSPVYAVRAHRTALAKMRGELEPKGEPSLPSLPPEPAPAPDRCESCGYLVTAPGHLMACGEVPR